MKRTVSAAVLVTTVACLAFAFQNCGRGFEAASSSGVSSASSAPTPTPTPTPLPMPSPTPNPPLFRAGDTFNPADMTALLGCSFKGGLATGVNEYSSLTGYYALAMAADCSGFISSFYDIASQAEANTMAMQACQVVSGGKPCAIVAEQNKFKYSSDALPSSFTTPLQVGLGGATLKLSNIPFISAQMRTYVNSFYVNAPAAEGAFKALAIYPNGAVGMGFSVTDQEDADQNALERCQGFARLQTCMIFAEGSNVVFGQKNLAWDAPASTIDLTQTALNVATIPFLEDASKTTLSGVTNLTTQYTLYITPLGGYAYAKDAATALATCKSNNASILYMDPCLLYAQNGVIKLTADQLQSAGFAPVAPVPISASAPATYTQVRSILQMHCSSCHAFDASVAKGGFSILTYASTMKEVTAGSSLSSVLFSKVSTGAMPPTATKLSGDEIAKIQTWIDAGAAAN